MTEGAAMGRQMPHVVVLGAGFAGLYAARKLARHPVRITVVDRRNHHLFQPLLYQVATATLSPSDIAAPVRALLRRPNVEVRLADALAVDVAERTVALSTGELSYDHLIVATGATHSYFGNDQWAAFAPGLKSVEDALEIRRRVLLSFEAAEQEPDPERRKVQLTFVIIGGGPTGVELAGALGEIAKHALRKDFRHIDTADARILLVEGLPRILSAYPPVLSTRAVASLKRLGVEVRTSAKVTAIDASGVTIGDERIAAGTVLWAAGVAASPLARSLGAPLDRAGRVKVTPALTLPDHPEVFVLGDLASLEQDGKAVPGVAPAAIQMGRHTAKNLVRAMRGEPLKPFRYWDKGTFAVIGRGSAVGQAFARVNIGGVLGWLAWLAVHLYFLIGFRNRLLVLINWSYSYLTFRRGGRLITYGPTPADAPGVVSARTSAARSSRRG